MESKIKMSTMPRLSPPDRDQAIAMLQARRVALIIARIFGVQHSTDVLLAERYGITGSSNDSARYGGTRVTTAAQDRANRPTHLREKFRGATQTSAETFRTHHRPVSARTVRTRSRAKWIRPYRPYVGSVLIQRQSQARVAWCRTRQRWTLQRWSQVAFSDDTKFQCFRADGRERVYRRRKRTGTWMPVYAKLTGGVVQAPWFGLQHQRIIAQIWCSLAATWTQPFFQWCISFILECTSIIYLHRFHVRMFSVWKI